MEMISSPGNPILPDPPSPPPFPAGLICKAFFFVHPASLRAAYQKPGRLSHGSRGRTRGCGALRRVADPARVALLSMGALTHSLFTNSVSEHDAGLRLPSSLPHLSSQRTDHRPNLLFMLLVFSTLPPRARLHEVQTPILLYVPLAVN